jgi:hypothetical protein
MAEATQILTDALESHAYDPWYTALLTAAMPEAKGDPRRAVAIADEIFAKHPKDMTRPASDDADALFSNQKG